MKPTGSIAGKGSKHERRHNNVTPHKHDKPHKHEGQDRHANDAPLTFEQMQRSLGGLRINHAALRASAWPVDRLGAAALLDSRSGKRPATLRDSSVDVFPMSPSSLRLLDYPLMQHNLRPHRGEGARGSEGRSGASRLELWTNLGHATWQIDVKWITGVPVGPSAYKCGVVVRDWHTQKQLSSGKVDPWSRDSVLACLERLSKRKGVPQTIIMEHQTYMIAQIEQWASAHGVTVVICRSAGSRRDSLAQMI
jgi:hypothetical protein